MSLNDSSVDFLARVEVGSHQRVAMTCWWSLRARLREEGVQKPPTSIDDSLVDVWEGRGR